MRYLSLLLVFACSTVVSQAQSHQRVLFLGNSYTNFNSLPDLVTQLAASAGDTVVTDFNTPGGHTMQDHASNATSLSLIKSQAWDAVVIQGQSQRPSFSPTQVAQQVLPFAAQLNDSVLANDSCTKTVFFMTWGRLNGDIVNCPNYPPVCTYAGMQGRLRDSYVQMATDNEAVTAPVGAAWQYIRNTNPTLGNTLYTADGSHPSLQGSYLAACVFYATLFHKSPVGLNYYGGLSASDAAEFQQAAALVVLDSLDQWEFLPESPQAGFATNITGSTVSIVDQSSDATQITWDWGDGNTGAGASPTHTYADSGTYTVRQIASNACESDTADTVITITIDANSTGNLTGSEASIKVYPSPVRDQLEIVLTEAWETAEVRIVDVQGRVLWQSEAHQRQYSVPVQDWPGGYYWVSVRQPNRAPVLKPFAVH